MGLCSAEKKRRAFKTIIIPKGIIDPNENNIIEIPVSLDANSSLIVKGPSDANSSFSVEPYYGNVREIRSQQHAMIQNPTPNYYSGNFPENNTGPSPSGRIDFGCQARLPYEQQSCQTQYPQLSPSLPFEDAHSPMCPICSRASCKFDSSSLINRSFGALNSSMYPSNQMDFRSFMNNRSYQPSFIHTPLEPSGNCSRKESKSKLNETQMLSKLLDEKIEKVVKPLLLSLTKSAIEEEENEIDDLCSGSSCSERKKCSFTANKSNVTSSTKEAFYSAADELPSFRRQSKKRDNFEADVSELPKRSSIIITGGNLMNQNQRYDFNDHRKRPSRFDREDEFSSTRYSSADRDDFARRSFNPGLDESFLSSKRSAKNDDFEDNYGVKPKNHACANIGSCQKRGDRSNVSFDEEDNRDNLRNNSRRSFDSSSL